MNPTRRIWSLASAVVLLAAGASGVAAQSNTDGSIYSRFGVGELQSFGSSQIQGLGGGGVGMHSFSYLNFANPGTWSDQVLVRAAGGFNYQSVSIKDASGATSDVTQGNLNAVQFSFPIVQRKVGSALFFQPYSRVNYRVRVPGRLDPTPEVPDTTDYTVNFEGSGGLQEVGTGLGYRLNDFLSVGANGSFVFGIIENGRTTSFISNDLTEANVLTSSRLTGFRGTVGAMVTIPSVVGKDDDLYLGLTFSTPTHLGIDRVNVVSGGATRDTLGVAEHGSLDLPYRLGFGASYRPNARWLFDASGLYEPWSGFSSDLPFPGVSPGSTVTLTDRLRGSFGVELFPAGTDLSASYLQLTAYRLGFFYDRSYVKPDAQTNLNTLGVTGGFSFPSLIPGTRIDINMEVGTRGTTNRGLVQDTFYKLSATINIGERWFQRRRLN